MQVMHSNSISVQGAANVTASYEHRLEEKLRRDAKRVRALEQRIERKLRLKRNPAGSYENVAKITAEFRSEVVLGLMQGSGEYFTRIGVGTLTREQFMVLDTSSDMVWIQCEPRSECYSQVDPIFNLAFSASFSTVGCDSAICSQLSAYNCHGGGCKYKVSYGDGSYTIGSYANEMLTFGATYVRNVAIGCGHNNVSLFTGAVGLLNLGAGPLSFPSQCGPQTGHAFSYSLLDRRQNLPVLSTSPRNPSLSNLFLRPSRRIPFFQLSTMSPSSRSVLVACSSTPFHLKYSPSINHPVVTRRGFNIDSGTAVKRLETAAYNTARDAFVTVTRKLSRVDEVSIFNNCYDLSSRAYVMVPVSTPGSSPRL